MTDMQLSLAQIAEWLAPARVLGDPATRCARVHTDTRTLAPGDLFVALKGERFDGAAFLAQAAAAGAAAALCGEAAEPALAASGLPGVLVADARVGLGSLAAQWRRGFTGPLVAVAGSNGKTTVTQMIAAVFQAWVGDDALATHGNLNNDIGLPLTLLRLRPHHAAAVVELGMNHPGEIARLAAIAAPTIALVTNAQREHQEFMGSVEAVARENAEALRALGTSGVAVFPAGDPHTPLWHAAAEGRRTLTFGPAGSQADVTPLAAEWRDDHWRVQAETRDGPIDFTLHAAGRHNVLNALAAIACATSAGVEHDVIAAGLGSFRPVAGRSRTVRLPVGGRVVTLIDDTYNANPDSVRALIDVLAELPAPRLLVLGDMGEVGAQGAAFHAEVGAYARERGVQQLMALGPLAAHAAAAFGDAGGHFESIESLTDAARAQLGAVQSVAVKGSRFMRMERVVDALQEAADAA